MMGSTVPIRRLSPILAAITDRIEAGDDFLVVDVRAFVDIIVSSPFVLPIVIALLKEWSGMEIVADATIDDIRPLLYEAILDSVDRMGGVPPAIH